MNLKNIIKPAVNGFIFIVLLTISMQYYSALFTPVSVSEVIDVAVTTLPTPSVSNTQNSTKTATPTSVAPTKKAPVKTPAPKPKPATCIITVNGSRYNVQALKSTHSGGNIFKCGTDMTAVFKSNHGTNYSLIAKYKI